MNSRSERKNDGKRQEEEQGMGRRWNEQEAKIESALPFAISHSTEKENPVSKIKNYLQVLLSHSSGNPAYKVALHVTHIKWSLSSLIHPYLAQCKGDNATGFTAHLED